MFGNLQHGLSLSEDAISGIRPNLNLTTDGPRHDKTIKVSVRPAKTQISLDIRPVWSESSLSAWRKLGSLAIHWADSEDSDQTGWMPRLIWVFAGHTLILLVLSCRGSDKTFVSRTLCDYTYNWCARRCANNKITSIKRDMSAIKSDIVTRRLTCQR